MNDGGSMLFGGGFMWILWIALIVLVIWSIKGLGNIGGNKTDRNDEKDSPIEILKKRYARGEIDEQEFERRKKELER